MNWSSYTASPSNCELDPIVHRQIIDKAVQLAFIAVKDQLGLQMSTAK